MTRCCQNLTMIKVCGLTRQEDLFFTTSLESSLAGFIFHPESPRHIDPRHARDLDTGPAMRVGVFVKQSRAEVKEIMEEARLHLAQLHGDQDEAFCAALGKHRVMRVFWPQRYAWRADLEQDLKRFAPHSRFYLLDSGSSGGGHGRSLDFSFLEGLISPKAWFIAGGLGPDNVLEAVQACNPCGVDLNSGVESAPGVKDHDKLKAALRRLCTTVQSTTQVGKE